MSKQPDSARRADRLLTDLEACEYLRIRSRQLYTWRIQGLIPFIRIGRALRYRQSDLDRALDALTVGGAAIRDGSHDRSGNPPVDRGLTALRKILGHGPSEGLIDALEMFI